MFSHQHQPVVDDVSHSPSRQRLHWDVECVRVLVADLQCLIVFLKSGLLLLERSI